jgi:VWFA-related protein
MTERNGVRWFAGVLLAGSALWILSNQGSAQISKRDSNGTSQADNGTPVFRATSRLVVVDVVVTDRNGQFVPNLKADNFKVLEDGKQQKVSSFTVHTAPVRNAVQAFKLPPHQYANFVNVAQQADRPVNVVLLDMLNTSGSDQDFARKQMIQFLKSLPSGQPMALFTLTSKLRMVQGFGANSDILVAAAEAMKPSQSLQNAPETQQQQEEITATAIETIGAPASMGPTPQNATMPIAPVGQALRDAMAAQDSFQKMERMSLTLEALNVLARAVAGYPGRKNLLWLSAEFPVAFGPGFSPYNAASDPLNQNVGRETNHQVRDLSNETPPTPLTSALLAAAQIAVYPIDVRGQVSLGTNLDISQQTANLGTVAIQNEIQTAGQRQVTTLWDAHEAMTEIAKQTGGEAIYGTNDLKGALSRSMRDGANYYTISYVPSHQDWNGKYRKIEIKGESGWKMNYRRGYYAVQERPVAENEASAVMASAMQFSVPEFTMVLMKVQVLPPDADHAKVRVDYAVDGHDLNFHDCSDQRKCASVDFVATAWDKDLNLVAHATDTMNATLRPPAYDQVMRTGLPFHQELELKPGTYTLRFGVMDRDTRKVGTVDVQLTTGKTESAAAAQPAR